MFRRFGARNVLLVGGLVVIMLICLAISLADSRELPQPTAAPGTATRTASSTPSASASATASSTTSSTPTATETGTVTPVLVPGASRTPIGPPPDFIGTAVAFDHDRDGYPVPDDCNDNDPFIHPGAPDPPFDGVDSDCDGNPNR